MASSEVDIGQLSESQQEALQQFTSVTNQELEAAIPLLQRSQWNVQIAIAKFFDGEQADPVAEAMAAQAAAPVRQARPENLQESLLMGSSPLRAARSTLDPAPRIVPQPEDQVVRRAPFVLSLLLTPFNLLYKIVASSLGLFGYLFPFLPRLFQPRTSSQPRRSRNTTGRRALNPRDTAARFKREFEEEYGENRLPLFENGYAQALDLAKQELKFLLVVLLSPEHDDTSTWVRETLLTTEVIDVISNPTNNIVVWAGNIQDSEAYQVSKYLRCTKFPYAALIAHATSNGVTAMSIVAKLSGPMPAATFVAKIQSAINTYSSQLAEARSARSAQQFERTLRQEQDSAYERSLAQDRERARQRREAEAAQAEANRRATERTAAAESYAANLEQWRRWRSQNIQPEPETSAKDSVRIALRLPESAERVTRRFRGDADIEELYAFAECYELLKSGEVIEKCEKPVGFDHKYGFRVVSPMPRTVYGLEEGGTILERVGRSGNLIVEPILEDDNEEDS